MVPKLRKFDCETEDPWRYMADLPLEHASTMRRYVFYHFQVQLFFPSHYSSTFLTPELAFLDQVTNFIGGPPASWYSSTTN
jgi:hypothetical protein